MPVKTTPDFETCTELATAYGTPLHIYDIDQIKENTENYMRAFRLHFPNFKQFFAIKALPNPEILKVLASCGMDFDASSKSEIYIAKKVSSYKNIMFTSNYTTKEELEYALKNKVILNLDDIDSLSFLNS